MRLLFKPMPNGTGRKAVDREEGKPALKLVTWNESYAIGHDRIDSEHREIFSRLDDCYISLMTGMELMRVVASYTEALELAGRHMREEEALFIGIGYPGAARHREEHARLAEKSREMLRCLSGNRDSVSFSELQFLLNWMMSHIIRQDKVFADYLRAGLKMNGEDCIDRNAVI